MNIYIYIHTIYIYIYRYIYIYILDMSARRSGRLVQPARPLEGAQRQLRQGHGGRGLCDNYLTNMCVYIHTYIYTHIT